MKRNPRNLIVDSKMNAASSRWNGAILIPMRGVYTDNETLSIEILYQNEYQFVSNDCMALTFGQFFKYDIYKASNGNKSEQTKISVCSLLPNGFA
jgi:hypothetical protein